LLVVMVIIAMLLALLLPAIQSVREAGRRTACSSNLYNQALAISRFNDGKRYIPGWRNAVANGAYAWPVAILPNMERKDVYDAMPQSVYLSFYVCPTSPPPTTTGPVLAYVGSAGVGSNATNRRGTGVMLDTGTTGGRVSLDDVAGNDGTATTVLLSEECGRLVADNQGSWNWSGSAITWTSGTAATPVFGIVSTAAPTKVVNSGTLGSATVSGAANMPNSQHPGGAVAAFCDGRTQFLKESLQAKVYAQIGSWNHTTSGTTTPYSTWVGTYSIISEADLQ
jgi:type II secretory pathway pseudopilin PulG